MQVDHAVGVDLRSASLCMELDCNTVFDGTVYRHCPRCGNAECYPLAVWLDRAGQARDAVDRERRGADDTSPLSRMFRTRPAERAKRWPC